MTMHTKALAAVAGIAFVTAVAVTHQQGHHGGIGSAATSTPDPFSQRNFPCQEDEALMYSPIFGPERVGCMNVEEILP